MLSGIYFAVYKVPLYPKVAWQKWRYAISPLICKPLIFKLFYVYVFFESFYLSLPVTIAMTTVISFCSAPISLFKDKICYVPFF